MTLRSFDENLHSCHPLSFRSTKTMNNEVPLTVGSTRKYNLALVNKVSGEWIRKRTPPLNIFQVARMGVKIPVLSPPPPKDPKHCSPLPPGCYRKRAVRRAKKESPGPRGGSSWTRTGITVTPWRIGPGGTSSMLLLEELVVSKRARRTTMEVLEDRSGSVRAALQQLAP